MPGELGELLSIAITGGFLVIFPFPVPGVQNLSS